VLDHLAEELRKFLVVEDLQTAARRDLADSRRVEAMVVVTVAALDEYTAVTETLGEHLTTHVVQVHTWRHTGESNNYMFIALNGNPSQGCQSYEASPAIWDHTVLPATQHKQMHPILTQYSIYLPLKDE